MKSFLRESLWLLTIPCTLMAFRDGMRKGNAAEFLFFYRTVYRPFVHVLEVDDIVSAPGVDNLRTLMRDIRVRSVKLRELRTRTCRGLG